MLLKSGTRLGRYDVVSAIGAGNMGEVYRGRDSRLDRPVAIKILRPDAGDDAAMHVRFEREARAVATLNHPHICTLHDVGEHDGIRYLIMEYLEGLPLSAVISAGPVPVDVALSYARQMASALDAAHSSGVVHRDLKPANVFVTGNGTVKVLDFGLAKMAKPAVSDSTVTMASTATRAGMFVGTIQYAAPEQLRGREVDLRADLFAFGAILYELLTGRRAFTGSSPFDVVAAILQNDPQSLPPGVPDWLVSVVMRCLAKDAAERFASARELLQSLAVSASSAQSTHAASPALPSLAVLPFADLSPDRDQEYFCDGMADELISALMTLDGLRIASRTSAFRFRGSGHDVTEVGRQLKVTSVLEGSVRRAGSRLRITVQLTDVREGFHIWSERYDRSLDDVFAVQDDIARAIVNKLKTGFTASTGTPIVRLATTNMQAYSAYLEGRYSLHKLTANGIARGMHKLREAIAAEPDFAEAHASLAHGYVIQSLLSLEPPCTVMPRAKEAATRAVALDSRTAEGHLVLALVLFWHDWQWDRAEQAFLRAIALSPSNAHARALFGMFLQLRGRTDESISEVRRALDHDPLHMVAHRGLASALHWAGRFEEAITASQYLIGLEPAFFSAYWILGLAYAGLGRYADAIAALEQGRAYAYGDAPLESFLGWAYALAGHRNEARAIAEQLQARRSTAGYLSGTNIALVYQGLGEMDEAMRWYQQACDDRAGDCVTYGLGPQFAAAREDPRFRALVERIESGS